MPLKWAMRTFCNTTLMAQDLTTSQIERQNILNNRIAIPRIQESLGVQTFEFEGRFYLTKQMVADYFEVDVRTIDNYLSNYEEELKHNGYVLCKGKMLKEFKLRFAHEIDFASKTTQLGLFDFRSFLNIGMLLNDSDKAKKLIARFLPAKTANHVRNRYGNSPIFRTDCKFLPFRTEKWPFSVRIRAELLHHPFTTFCGAILIRKQDGHCTRNNDIQCTRCIYHF